MAETCIHCKDTLIAKVSNRGNEFTCHHRNTNCSTITTQLAKTTSDDLTESEIHLTAKETLAQLLRTVVIVITTQCMYCQKIEDHVFEPVNTIYCEHPFIHNGPRYADIARIIGAEMTIFEIKHTSGTLRNSRPEPWFEIDAADVSPDCINYKCVRSKSCCGGTITVNQRGAGNGKTYEAVQLAVKANPCKQVFIYLTKMHTTKNTIKQEFDEQYADGQLASLAFIECEETNKKYVIKYTTHDNMERIILIGTIDSFTYALSDKLNLEKNPDVFKSYILTLRKGMMSSKLKYAGYDLDLFDERAIIVIDESQDLPKVYFDAFEKFVELYNVDLYIVGDILQSLDGEHNVMAHLQTYKAPNILRSAGDNIFRRTHNNKFIEYINNKVPFKKYGSSEIIAVCTDDDCRHIKTNDIPYHVSLVPTKDKNGDINYITTVEYVLKCVDIEVNKHNYSPANFMFIMPIMKTELPGLLQAELQDYWINKFKSGYICNDPYFDNWDSDQVFDYAFVHKHTQGTSIDTTLSTHSSRIMSIKASKGSGREVVFVLDMNEYALTMIAIAESLQYESYIHVAITRQKHDLYIILANATDDIYHRFKLGDDCAKINISKTLRTASLVQSLPQLHTEFLDKYANKLCEDSADIIEFVHHTIRRMSLCYTFWANMYHANLEKQQHYAIIKKIQKLKSKRYRPREYNKRLYQKHICDKCNKCQTWATSSCNEPRCKGILKGRDDFPVLYFNNSSACNYNKYAELMEKHINHIQKKLIECTHGLPTLCPLEQVILMFMIQVDYKDVSIMEIYKILHVYYSSLHTAEISHKRYECLCTPNSTMKSAEESVVNSIVHHYEETKKMKILLEEYNNIVGNDGHYRINEYYKSSVGDDISLRAEITFSYHTDDTTYHIQITPILNALNYNGEILDGLVDTFYIKQEVAKNKSIKFILLALNQPSPLVFKFEWDVIPMIKIGIRHHMETFYKLLYDRHVRGYKLTNDDIMPGYMRIYYNVCRKNKKLTYTDFVIGMHSRLDELMLDIDEGDDSSIDD
jgi:hypothetical protein